MAGSAPSRGSRHSVAGRKNWTIPRYDGGSVVNLAATVFRAGGGPKSAWPALAPGLAPKLEPFHGRARGPIVLFLVDGLGWTRFCSWRSRRARRVQPTWAVRAGAITTVFPSTTTVALVSLSTACPPSWHGVVGYRQYIPRFASVVDILKMSPTGSPASEALVGPNWSPLDISACPSVFQRGLNGVALSRDRFRGSAFTEVLYEGAEYVDYTTASDLAYQLASILDRPRPPSVVYAYWDELDTVMHLRGVDDDLSNLEVGRVFELLGFAARSVSRSVANRTSVLITGDHGQVPVTRAADVRLDELPRITELMARPLAGDRRAAFFQAVPGQREELAARLRQELPKAAAILDMDEAVAAGWFGPPPHHPELLDRLGDWLVLVPPPAGITSASPAARGVRRFLYAAHGGLDPAEMRVPLIHARLSDFAKLDAP